MVTDDKAIPRGTAERVSSRAAAGVATELGGVTVAETETDSVMKWRVVLQGGKQPREALQDGTQR